jgi:hypothetical protein
MISQAPKRALREQTAEAALRPRSLQWAWKSPKGAELALLPWPQKLVANSPDEEKLPWSLGSHTFLVYRKVPQNQRPSVYPQRVSARPAVWKRTYSASLNKAFFPLSARKTARLVFPRVYARRKARIFSRRAFEVLTLRPSNGVRRGAPTPVF